MELKLRLGFYHPNIYVWRENACVEIRGDKEIVEGIYHYLLKYVPVMTSSDDMSKFKVE